MALATGVGVGSPCPPQAGRATRKSARASPIGARNSRISSPSFRRWRACQTRASQISRVLTPTPAVDAPPTAAPARAAPPDGTASPRRRSAPMKWLPIGRPSAFQYSGTDIAGCPVMLQSRRERHVLRRPDEPRSGLSGGESSVPSGSGGSASVGVSQTSWSRKKRAMSRDERWSTVMRQQVAGRGRPCAIWSIAHVSGSTSLRVGWRRSAAPARRWSRRRRPRRRP